MDAGTRFHIHAYNRLRQIIHADSIVSWGTKRAKGFLEEFRIKSVFAPELSILRFHELSIDEQKDIWTNTSHASLLVWVSRICDAVELIKQTNYSMPHVLFSKCNENIGDFSRYVPENKTADRDGGIVWTLQGCQSDQEVFDYLTHPNTRAVFTTQHQWMDHPKVHSLPLGIKYTMKDKILKLLQEPPVTKSKLLMINDNGWKHRKQVTAAVMENFAKENLTLTNTYNFRKSSSYLEELRLSKFILAPSGLGWDCYRIWEALHFSTIPIIERYHRPNDGWRRTLDGLPVLWVEEFSEVTPSVLLVEYERIALKWSEYEYEKLTRQWWIRFIQSHVDKA